MNMNCHTFQVNRDDDDGKIHRSLLLLTSGTEDGSFSYISAIDSAYKLLAPERKLSDARVENNARIVTNDDGVIRRDAARRRTRVAMFEKVVGSMEKICRELSVRLREFNLFFWRYS